VSNEWFRGQILYVIDHMKSNNIMKLVVACCVSLVVGNSYAEQEKYPNATKGDFFGYEMYDFQLERIKCKVVEPKVVAEGKPWIIRARFWGHWPLLDQELLARGFHVAYADVSGLFGAPRAVKRWDQFYAYMTETHGMSSKVALEGMSRGGLIIYNWAIANPEKVSCLYGDAPVCDFKSWPSVKNRGLLNAYQMTEEEALAYKGNPVDNLAPLAEAGVKLMHVVGDVDDVVPVAENTAVIESRYKALGGKITVIHKPEVGHHPHGLKDPAPLVEFVLANTK